MYGSQENFKIRVKNLGSLTKSHDPDVQLTSEQASLPGTLPRWYQIPDDDLQPPPRIPGNTLQSASWHQFVIETLDSSPEQQSLNEIQHSPSRVRIRDDTIEPSSRHQILDETPPSTPSPHETSISWHQTSTTASKPTVRHQVLDKTSHSRPSQHLGETLEPSSQPRQQIPNKTSKSTSWHQTSTTASKPTVGHQVLDKTSHSRPSQHLGETLEPSSQPRQQIPNETPKSTSWQQIHSQKSKPTPRHQVLDRTPYSRPRQHETSESTLLLDETLQRSLSQQIPSETSTPHEVFSTSPQPSLWENVSYPESTCEPESTLLQNIRTKFREKLYHEKGNETSTTVEKNKNHSFPTYITDLPQIIECRSLAPDPSLNDVNDTSELGILQAGSDLSELVRGCSASNVYIDSQNTQVMQKNVLSVNLTDSLSQEKDIFCRVSNFAERSRQNQAVVNPVVQINVVQEQISNANISPKEVENYSNVLPKKRNLQSQPTGVKSLAAIPGVPRNVIRREANFDQSQEPIPVKAASNDRALQPPALVRKCDIDFRIDSNKKYYRQKSRPPSKNRSLKEVENYSNVLLKNIRERNLQSQQPTGTKSLAAIPGVPRNNVIRGQANFDQSQEPIPVEAASNDGAVQTPAPVKKRSIDYRFDSHRNHFRLKSKLSPENERVNSQKDKNKKNYKSGSSTSTARLKKHPSNSGKDCTAIRHDNTSSSYLPQRSQPESLPPRPVDEAISTIVGESVALLQRHLDLLSSTDSLSTSAVSQNENNFSSTPDSVNEPFLSIVNENIKLLNKHLDMIAHRNSQGVIQHDSRLATQADKHTSGSVGPQQNRSSIPVYEPSPSCSFLRPALQTDESSSTSIHPAKSTFRVHGSVLQADHISSTSVLAEKPSCSTVTSSTADDQHIPSFSGLNKLRTYPSKRPSASVNHFDKANEPESKRLDPVLIQPNVPNDNFVAIKNPPSQLIRVASTDQVFRNEHLHEISQPVCSSKRVSSPSNLQISEGNSILDNLGVHKNKEQQKEMCDQLTDSSKNNSNRIVKFSNNFYVEKGVLLRKCKVVLKRLKLNPLPITGVPELITGENCLDLVYEVRVELVDLTETENNCPSSHVEVTPVKPTESVHCHKPSGIVANSPVKSKNSSHSIKPSVSSGTNKEDAGLASPSVKTKNGSDGMKSSVLAVSSGTNEDPGLVSPSLKPTASVHCNKPSGIVANSPIKSKNSSDCIKPSVSSGTNKENAGLASPSVKTKNSSDGMKSSVLAVSSGTNEDPGLVSPSVKIKNSADCIKRSDQAGPSSNHPKSAVKVDSDLENKTLTCVTCSKTKEFSNFWENATRSQVFQCHLCVVKSFIAALDPEDEATRSELVLSLLFEESSDEDSKPKRNKKLKEKKTNKKRKKTSSDSSDF